MSVDKMIEVTRPAGIIRTTATLIQDLLEAIVHDEHFPIAEIKAKANILAESTYGDSKKPPIETKTHDMGSVKILIQPAGPDTCRFVKVTAKGFEGEKLFDAFKSMESRVIRCEGKWQIMTNESNHVVDAINVEEKPVLATTPTDDGSLSDAVELVVGAISSPFSAEEFTSYFNNQKLVEIKINAKMTEYHLSKLVDSGVLALTEGQYHKPVEAVTEDEPSKVEVVNKDESSKTAPFAVVKGLFDEQMALLKTGDQFAVKDLTSQIESRAEEQGYTNLNKQYIRTFVAQYKGKGVIESLGEMSGKYKVLSKKPKTPAKKTEVTRKVSEALRVLRTEKVAEFCRDDIMGRIGKVDANKETVYGAITRELRSQREAGKLIVVGSRGRFRFAERRIAAKIPETELPANDISPKIPDDDGLKVLIIEAFENLHLAGAAAIFDNGSLCRAISKHLTGDGNCIESLRPAIDRCCNELVTKGKLEEVEGLDSRWRKVCDDGTDKIRKVTVVRPLDTKPPAVRFPKYVLEPSILSLRSCILSANDQIETLQQQIQNLESPENTIPEQMRKVMIASNKQQIAAFEKFRTESEGHLRQLESMII